MIPTPEKESDETRIIKEQFLAWEKLIDEELFDPEDPVDLDEGSQFTLEFCIDKANDDHSWVNHDTVNAAKLYEPEEAYAFVPLEIIPEDGERWIRIEVNPTDPYAPRISVYRYKTPGGGNSSQFYIEASEIFLSDKGRAFERTHWAYIAEPLNDPEKDHVAQLTKFPEKEELYTVFENEDPTDERIGEKRKDILPFQPLRGKSLERLDFIRAKHNIGQTMYTAVYY